jgi:hypothetical protein
MREGEEGREAEKALRGEFKFEEDPGPLGRCVSVPICVCEDRCQVVLVSAADLADSEKARPDCLSVSLSSKTKLKYKP